MSSYRLHTEFASAERASAEDVAREHRLVMISPLVTEVIQRMPHVALVLNRERQIIYGNACLLGILGVQNFNDVKGLRPGEAFHCVHADETEGGCGTTRHCAACGAVLAILASQETDTTQVRECRLTWSKNGHSDALDLRVWTDPIEISGQKFIVMLIMDISDEKRRKALERVFFHDIKNTAGAILGAVELTGLDMQEPRQSQLPEQLAALVEQLLREIVGQEQLLAAENDELQLSSATLDLPRALHNIVNRCCTSSLAHKRTVRCDAPPGLSITTDQTVLDRIVTNMLKNALEASDPGDTITVEANPTADGVRIEVHNPQAMAPEVQLQVFQRSFSTKGPNRGLGTYGIKLLAERYLGGRVHFRSNTEHGTSFYVDLPATPPSQSR